ncbi:RAMP superfamily CRISPR-associated protein [Microcoleus sp. LAD1_D5]|uniref:RAMP superfamily CRISPR-associated protein n=1 Tax=Microcoleus sp. LAD1_D5 TaxID=2818813 RepID=UPI002FD4ADA8
MYLAQIEGRCSLQYTAEDEDRQQWLKEWIDPKNDGESYQHKKRETRLGSDNIYRIELKFPWRVFSNGGKDSIPRPVLGKNGIPFIPGSSIKGLFKRVCNSKQKKLYCGDENNPGCLRFHGAYPIGNWAKNITVTETKDGVKTTKVCYLIEDVVHPQQKRQIEKETTTSASALISFYEPTFSFEFSNVNENINWTEVESILHQALSRGLGGKTSTGYGFVDSPEYAKPTSSLYNNAEHIRLEGTGVSSKLINGQPEFRPNLFKATLRGHTIRLLSGLINDKLIDRYIDRLFGSTNNPGSLQLYWENKKKISFDKKGRKETNPTYKVEGILHICSQNTQEVSLIGLVIKFAFILGGFGKSWRRVSHEQFYKEYFQAQNKYDIGCHWKSLDEGWIDIKNSDDLGKFLGKVRNDFQKYLGSNPNYQPSNKWREVWHPDRVAVYSNVVQKSEVIELFHNEVFKYTPAIGGRNLGDKRPTAVSSVWHRMLPIGDGNYLEIVTLFHHARSDWKHKTQGNQLSNFIQELESAGLTLSWGSEPAENP